MLEFLKSSASKSDLKSQITAIHRSMAVIEFTIDGKITDANDNFLNALGYRIEDVRGRHHSMFMKPEAAQSAEYKQFWQRLARGDFIADQFLRVAADGHEVWIEASYNPLLDSAGKPHKIVKFATVITDIKERQADFEGQIAAINKAMAVITFTLDGRIIHANDLFLSVAGYELNEVVGQHHSMFCEPDYRESEAYKQFWIKLGRGAYDSGQYPRVGKGGREFWVAASYNPILDALGRPTKVIKYASVVTEQMQAARQLSNAVVETTQVIEAAKNKDLTRRIDLAGKHGDIGKLCGDVNGLLDSVSEVISTVGGVARKIKTTAAKFAADSDHLAERTESQASSLQQTAATTEELSASIKQSAGHSRQAAALGEDAKTVAAHGGEIVAEAVVAMERIEQASSSISDIISMIDEIAFQTNLLALNAAVEAARAGDAGRGFAVVASEVRALAKRSSESANGIKGLIANSSAQVRSGVGLVKDAGTKLGEIVTAATKVASTIGEISSASLEQASGVEEMAKTVAHMDEMTQQNSLLADGSSKLARELLIESEHLNEMVDAFLNDMKDQHRTVGQIGDKLAAPLLNAEQRIVGRPKLRVAGGASHSNNGWSEF